MVFIGFWFRFWFWLSWLLLLHSATQLLIDRQSQHCGSVLRLIPISNSKSRNQHWKMKAKNTRSVSESAISDQPSAFTRTSPTPPTCIVVRVDSCSYPFVFVPPVERERERQKTTTCAFLVRGNSICTVSPVSFVRSRGCDVGSCRASTRIFSSICVYVLILVLYHLR